MSGYKIPARLDQFTNPNIYLRVRRPSDGIPVQGAVLFVHGATIASSLFDLPIKGYSLLDACASQGWWAFAIDLRGYGNSTKPAAMDLPPLTCPVQCTGDDAIANVDSAISHIQNQYGIKKIALVGGSWGSLICARYSAVKPANISRLALLAPLYASVNMGWLRALSDPAYPSKINPQLGGYRYVSKADLLSRWDPEIPDTEKSVRRPPSVLAALLEAEFAADQQSPIDGTFRVPNGTLHELFEVFSGRPIYKPEEIACPTLLVRGADDQTSTHQDCQKLIAALRTPSKTLQTIAGAGHFMQVEHQAPTVQRILLEFLRS